MKTHNTTVFSEFRSSGRRKRFLISENGHKCQRCKNSEWMGSPIPLCLDHVDGNSDNDEKSNLRLLCHNCHAQTPTFGGKNVGRFPNAKRYHKMKIYKSERKSVADSVHRKHEAAGSSPAVLTTFPG